MGNYFSKPKKLNYNKRKSRKMRIIVPETSKTVSSKYIIDHYPQYLDHSYYISLEPQKVILEFTVSKADNVHTFTLENAQHIRRISQMISVESDQILIPLLALANIDLDNAIIHYLSGDHFHLRIAATQLGKVWKINNDQLTVFCNGEENMNWTVQITDHNTWSTG
jgi:hypothetical protein